MIAIMPSEFTQKLSELTFVTRSFAAGALVFERGDEAKYFFRVESGLVHSLRRQEDGSEFIMQRAAVGDVLGDASLTHSTYHCAAVAVDPSELALFSHREVQKFIAENGAIARLYADHLAGELRGARLRAEIVSLRKVSDRLDAWFAWNESYVPQKGKWNRVAGEIGVSPEALYRELARRRKK